jgi:hypothetical protein
MSSLPAALAAAIARERDECAARAFSPLVPYLPEPGAELHASQAAQLDDALKAGKAHEAALLRHARGVQHLLGCSYAELCEEAKGIPERLRAIATVDGCDSFDPDRLIAVAEGVFGIEVPGQHRQAQLARVLDARTGAGTPGTTPRPCASTRPPATSCRASSSTGSTRAERHPACCDGGGPQLPSLAADCAPRRRLPAPARGPQNGSLEKKLPQPGRPSSSSLRNPASRLRKTPATTADGCLGGATFNLTPSGSRGASTRMPTWVVSRRCSLTRAGWRRQKL